jgi:trk system potassium uptake protein
MEFMKAVIVGCGRVGSTLARNLADSGWEVVVIELREENLNRLGPEWRHPVVLGHGMDTAVLEEAGIKDADVLIAATDGDNTNLVVAQVAKERYHVAHVAARIQDPARADAYADRGFEVISPVKMAIDGLTGWAMKAGAIEGAV